MNEVTFYGIVKDGKLIIQGRKSFDIELQFFNGEEVEGRIRKRKRNRSLNQNAYLHGCVYPLIQEGLLHHGIRTSLTEVHEMMKLRFLKKDIPIGDNGEYVTTVLSTATLTTIEFMDYIEQISQFGAEYLGIVIPAPNTQQMLFNND